MIASHCYTHTMSELFLEMLIIGEPVARLNVFAVCLLGRTCIRLILATGAQESKQTQ